MNAVALKAEGAVTTCPRLLSLREAVVLADVPEKEKCVRKDIDAGVFAPANIIAMHDAHSRFAWASVVAFAAVYGNDLLVDSRNLRKTAYNKVFLFASGNAWAVHRDMKVCNFLVDTNCFVDIDNFLTIPVGRVCARVKPRMDLYSDGLARVEEKDSVMGGAAVFKDTRLPVHHVAAMIKDGESVENILEDYPYLTRGDIEFAMLYDRAKPLVGRPRSSGGTNNDTGNAG